MAALVSLGQARRFARLVRRLLHHRADHGRHLARHRNCPAEARVRVGIFVGEARPDAGGGFTVVDEIIRAVRSSREQARHEFRIVLTSSDSSPYEDAYRGMPVVSLKTAFSAGHPLPARIGRFLRRTTVQALGVEASGAYDYISTGASRRR